MARLPDSQFRQPDSARPDRRVVACREIAEILGACRSLLGGDRYCGQGDSAPLRRCLDYLFAVARGGVPLADIDDVFLGMATAMAMLVADNAMLRVRLRDARGDRPEPPDDR